MPGRGDAYEKYLETLVHWHRAGWEVTAADWRGQAGSGRLGRDRLAGHIDDFSIWIDDLSAFWHGWVAGRPGPHILAGHSMGGHLALRAVVEKAIVPDGLILSAPMLGIGPKFVPTAVLHGVAWTMSKIGDPTRTAWKASEKPSALPAERIVLLTHDRDRYEDELFWREQRPEIAMGPGSWGWVKSAVASVRGLHRPGSFEGVDIPVHIVATSADLLVDSRAIKRAARRLPDCELMMFGAEARHEILREADPVRDRALAGIDAFLARLEQRETAA